MSHQIYISCLVNGRLKCSLQTDGGGHRGKKTIGDERMSETETLWLHRLLLTLSEYFAYLIVSEIRKLRFGTNTDKLEFQDKPFSKSHQFQLFSCSMSTIKGDKYWNQYLVANGREPISAKQLQQYLPNKQLQKINYFNHGVLVNKSFRDDSNWVCIIV